MPTYVRARERAPDRVLPPSQDLLGRIAHAWRLMRQVTASMRRPGLDEPGPGRPYPRMQLPLAFLTGPWKLAMGLSALDPADWLWRDAHFADEIAERQALLARHRDQVLAMLPEAASAIAELV